MLYQITTEKKVLQTHAKKRNIVSYIAVEKEGVTVYDISLFFCKILNNIRSNISLYDVEKLELNLLFSRTSSMEEKLHSLSTYTHIHDRDIRS